MKQWEFKLGDCLELLPDLEPMQFDVCVADPPYIIGGASIGDPRTKSGTWADMVNAATWYVAWFDAVARVLKPSGHLLVFGNWRSLPTYLCAAARSPGLFPSSCLVWDKVRFGPASKRQLRPRWELVLWLTMPEAKIEDRAAPDVLAHKWSAGHNGTSGHPAEKPRPFLRRLLRIASASGGRVLDPFAGRASSGLAALDLDMQWCGIESDPLHHEAGSRALEEHKSETLLFDGSAA